jgi:hypothetical protein
MPYEAARARLMLAEVVRALEPEVSKAEARTALSAFEILGAERDADAATALLRELGVKAARAGPKNLGTLTKRETKVLELLGQGLSNDNRNDMPALPQSCSSAGPAVHRSGGYTPAHGGCLRALACPGQGREI